MKRSTTPRSNLPVPKGSRGTPTNSKSLIRGGNFAHSAEDIPRRVQYSLNSSTSPQRRAISPGNDQRNKLTVARQGNQSPQAGVRYITEELIKKIAKEENIEMISTLNLTLAREGGKKIKYIENLDRLKRLTSLNLSCNMIEKIEKLEKLIKLKELNLSYNCIAKIEGMENLAGLQVLNLSGNTIEHIPIWMGKRLKALRSLHLGKNNMQSMSELAKLKPLPDLTELTVAENPLCQIPHCRLYLIFHLRTLEVLDSQKVTEQERRNARDRFEQDEVERLEKQLELEEARVRKLEEDKNRSAQETSLSRAAEEETRQREMNMSQKIKDYERELEAKNDLLKKKTGELNKACEKHYQLEQELAFHKIDSKFDSLGHSPGYQDGDDSGQLDESPYIGRARYKANQYAREGPNVSISSPQHAHVRSIPTPQRAEIMDKLHSQLDNELAEKQDKVQKTEDRLKRLQEDMLGTERKLQQATKDLKRMGDITEKDDVKMQLRQRLAKKMQLVNDLRDSATQIEEEIEKTRDTMHENKLEVARLKGQLDRLDSKDPKYRKTYAEMVDKEQQISESNQMYGQLQQQLEVMLDTIAKETNDIKKLEQQLNDDKIDANESLRTELDEIVGGLQSYLSNVKGQGLKRQRDFETLLGEKADLQEKVKNLEDELRVIDADAGNYKQMEVRLLEMEENFNNQQGLNKTLEDQLHRTRTMDADYQDKLENTSAELMDVKKALREAERKAQYEKQTIEVALQTEKEKAKQAMHQARKVDNLEDDNRRLLGQLEAVKAQNMSFKDQLNNEKESRLRDTVPQNELKKRLRELSHSVKTGKGNVEPQDSNDYLGKTFKDLQLFMNDKMNTSFKAVDSAKKRTKEADAEIQALRESLKKAENKLAKRDEKGKEKDNKLTMERRANEDEMKRMQNEIERLKAKLKDTINRAAQGQPVTKIVYRPESESDRSSMNSEEKALFDELQRELMELRRNMRNTEEENAKLMNDMETEAAMMEQAFRDQEKQYEDELSKTREETELLREKAEARMQVIAQDLDQAHQVAENLRAMLDARDQQLGNELQHNEMSNHMMVAQEDELAKLYEILDTQRDEIEHLNDMLDQMYNQGGQPGPLFEDDLWRLRQEVNRLKETLAMQSAYIQTMPQVLSTAGTQAGGAQTTMGTQFDPPPQPGFRPDVVPPGQGMPRPVLSQQVGAPVSMIPPPVNRSNMGTSYSLPLGTAYPPPPAVVGQGHAGHPYTPKATSSGNTGQPASGDARVSHGSRRHGDKNADSAAETDKMSSKSGRSHRSRASHRSRGSRSKDKERQVGPASRHSTCPKTAFEPVQRPQVYRPVASSGTPGYPQQTTLGTVGEPSGVPAGVPGVGGASMVGVPAVVPGVGGASVAGQPMPASSFHSGHGPTFPVVESGYHSNVSPTRGGGYPVVSGGVPQRSGGVRPTPGIIGGGGPVLQAHKGPLFSASTQTPGYASTQTPGYGPGTHSHDAAPRGPTVAPVHVGAPAATQTYIPVAATPAQNLAYNSGRVFLPAYSTSTDKPPGRMYYPSGGRIPLKPSGGPTGGAPPPPPPPPPPIQMIGPPSPRPHVTFLPVNPIAAGTPVRTSRGHANGSMSAPPSPILAGAVMDQPRGILKNNEGLNDDSYLFCNVPEHHDLEDYIAELQEKLKRLKAKVARDQAAEADDDTRLIRRLRGELEERRDELEGLDLAIERQKKSLKDLRKEERQLEVERKDAKEELEFLRNHNLKSSKKRRMLQKMMEDETDSDDSMDAKMAGSRQRYLRDEVDSLERTLAKRRAQLRDADKLLKQCNTDLKDARDQARDTIDKYDSAAYNLESTVKETSELERRANLAGVELVKAADQLGSIRAEVKNMECKKGKQERLLRDINQVINKRDQEYKDLESRVKSASQHLQRVQTDLVSTSQREKETMSSLRDAEEVLGKRRAEIARMREQIELQRRDLEKVDQAMGKKRTELQMLQDTAERKQTELSAVLRDADAEVGIKQRELRECREYLRDLEMQKNDLLSSLKSKRGELHKVKEEVETEDEVLQKLIASVNKHKAELKHLYEMQKLEQTELNSVKSQHAQKLAELEKTQRQLVDEKSDLEQLNAEINRKASELERLRQTVDHDRQEVERLSLDKRSLEDRITAMTREKELLDDNCKNLDNKINQMKRTHTILDEKIETSGKRLEVLEMDLQQREKEMDEATHQRSAMQKEIHSMKIAAKESKTELKSLKEQVRDTEDNLRQIEQNLRDTHLQRDDSKMEVERLNEAIRTSRLSYDDYIRQEKQKHEELQELLKSVAGKEFEYQEARMALNKVRKDVEREENKLNKLVSNANLELENIRTDLHSKELELEQATIGVNSLKRESEKLQATEEKFVEMEKHVRELEREILDRNEEKNELAKALSRSYEELQKLRTEAAHEHEKTTKDRLHLENVLHDLQAQLELTKQEMRQMQKRTTSQVSELQNIAEVQFNKANRLDSELSKARKDNKDFRKQLLTQNAILEKMNIEKLKEFEAQINSEKELQGPSKSCQEGESTSQDTKHSKDHDHDDNLERHLEALKQILPLKLIDRYPESWKLASDNSLLASENKENIFRSTSSSEDKEDLRDKLTQEQDFLRLQLQQQMQRHADAMESARLQSEGTIENLRTKLNALQEVIVNSGDSKELGTIKSYNKSRSRSLSPGRLELDTSFLKERHQSPSPAYSRRGYLAQRPRSRSRSEDRVPSPSLSSRDFLTS